jgi:hypothetical protein
MIDITSMQIECDATGDSKVTLWVKCKTAEDIDDVTLWLAEARALMIQWKGIRTARGDRTNVTPLKKEKP